MLELDRSEEEKIDFSAKRHLRAKKMAGTSLFIFQVKPKQCIKIGHNEPKLILKLYSKSIPLSQELKRFQNSQQQGASF